MFRSWTALLLLTFVVTQIAIFTTTVFLHRTLSHHAVTLKPGVTMAFRVITWITTGLGLTFGLLEILLSPLTFLIR